MSNLYGATALTGGGTKALDGSTYYDGDDLVDGDGAIVITSSAVYAFHLDAASGAAENSPLVISPDANAGNKRWLLKEGVFAGLTLVGGGTTTTSLLIDSGGHANIKLDRGSSSYDGGFLFYTGSTLDWRMQQSIGGFDLNFIEDGVGTHLQIKSGGKINIGDSFTAANATRTFNLCSTDAVLRILRIHGSSGAGLDLITRATPDGADTGHWHIFTSAAEDLVFLDRLGGDVERVIFLHNGRVGFGATPLGNFHVEATGGTVTFLLNNNQAGTQAASMYFFGGSGGGGGYFAFRDNATFNIGTAATLGGAISTKFTILNDGGIKMLSLKSGANQGAAGAAANELWRDTADNSIKLGV